MTADGAESKRGLRRAPSRKNGTPSPLTFADRLGAAWGIVDMAGLVDQISLKIAGCVGTSSLGTSNGLKMRSLSLIKSTGVGG